MQIVLTVGWPYTRNCASNVSTCRFKSHQGLEEESPRMCALEAKAAWNVAPMPLPLDPVEFCQEEERLLKTAQELESKELVWKLIFVSCYGF